MYWSGPSVMITARDYYAENLTPLLKVCCSFRREIQGWSWDKIAQKKHKNICVPCWKYNKIAPYAHFISAKFNLRLPTYALIIDNSNRFMGVSETFQGASRAIQGISGAIKGHCKGFEECFNVFQSHFRVFHEHFKGVYRGAFDSISGGFQVHFRGFMESIKGIQKSFRIDYIDFEAFKRNYRGFMGVSRISVQGRIWGFQKHL